MDNFDYKKYLAEGKLFEEDREEQYVDPFDNPDFYDGEGNMKDEYYKEEFGFSFKEKQNWEKILDQVKKQNNFDVFDAKSLRNYDKIEDEANQIYTQKYGSPFLKENKLVKEDFSITGEYEGEPVINSGEDLEDYLRGIMVHANSGEDFVRKVEYGITDETSSISEEDKEKLIQFYEDNETSKGLGITMAQKYRLDSLTRMQKLEDEEGEEVNEVEIEQKSEKWDSLSDEDKKNTYKVAKSVLQAYHLANPKGSYEILDVGYDDFIITDGTDIYGEHSYLIRRGDGIIAFHLNLSDHIKIGPKTNSPEELSKGVKKVMNYNNKGKWRRLSDEDRETALLSAIEDPDNAQEYIDFRYEDLPSEVTSNMIFEDEDGGDIISVAKSILKDQPMDINNYLNSLRNDIRLNGSEGYIEFGDDDWVEDYSEFIVDKLDS